MNPRDVAIREASIQPVWSQKYVLVASVVSSHHVLTLQVTAASTTNQKHAHEKAMYDQSH